MTDANQNTHDQQHQHQHRHHHHHHHHHRHQHRHHENEGDETKKNVLGELLTPPASPQPSRRQKRCDNCGVLEDREKHIVMKECSICHGSLYCSKECQRQHCKCHRRDCVETTEEYAKFFDYIQ